MEPLPSAPQDSGPKVGYETRAPGVLTPVKVTSSGGVTVEYLGRNAIDLPCRNSAAALSISIRSRDVIYRFCSELSLTGNNATWVNRPRAFVDLCR